MAISKQSAWGGWWAHKDNKVPVIRSRVVF